MMKLWEENFSRVDHTPAVFRITSKWTYLRPQKVPNTSKFWDKDVSKRPEFPEFRPKFERWM